MSEHTSVHSQDRVRSTAQRNSGISWPVPVDRRLDQLLELATDVGERTTRKELLAAIVVAFDPTTDLGELLRRYRLARVRDVLVHDPTGTDDDGVIEFPLNRPGPRRIASAGGDDDG